MWGFFLCSCGPSVCALWKMSIQILCLFLISFFLVCVLFLLLGYMPILYILNINDLSGIWFANIFSYSLSWLLLIVSSPVQKLFSLMYFHMYIFAFVSCVFGVKSKKVLPTPLPSSLFLYFLFSILWVWADTD